MPTATTTTTTTTCAAPITTVTTTATDVCPASEVVDGELRSPQKGDMGFADTVHDIVDIVKYETSRKGRIRCEIHKLVSLRVGLYRFLYFFL